MPKVAMGDWLAACSAGPGAEGVQAQRAEGRMLTSAPVSTRNFRPVVRSETKNRRLGGWPGMLVAISTWPGCFPLMYRGRYT